MANNDSFDPKKLAEYKLILEQVEEILSRVVASDRAIVDDATIKSAKVREELDAFEQLVELKFREVQASSQSLDQEEKRNLLLQQYRTGLQEQLAKLTTSHYQNQRALRSAESELKRIVDQLNRLGTKTADNAVQFDALTRKQVTSHQEVLRLKSEQVNYDETERQAIIQKITAEMQYADAKLKTSEHVQRNMTMFLQLDNSWRQTLAGSLTQMMSAATKAHGVVQGLASTAAHLATTISNVWNSS